MLTNKVLCLIFFASCVSSIQYCSCSPEARTHEQKNKFQDNQTKIHLQRLYKACQPPSWLRIPKNSIPGYCQAVLPTWILKKNQPHIWQEERPTWTTSLKKHTWELKHPTKKERDRTENCCF
ncbi:MAG: hypothetical protein CL947_01485 [Epsilonproteobacteria bacterium]|nr:hypothetical protein [Campylobacterota bacterium]|tara:strand:+ start:3189 stop:3554 length:366 start_codon:yes stop_codon:yes gene_type:complete